MEFKAYGKTKTVADGKTISKFTSKYPVLLYCGYVATEKLDGTNMTLFIDRTGNTRIGSRNREILDDMTHFDCHNAILKQYEEEILELVKYCIRFKSTIRIYGELYGPGILPRIDYGPEKRFLPFQLEIDGIRQSVRDSVDFMNEKIGYPWWVPPIKYFEGLGEALRFDVDDNPDVKDREGVVIEPYSVVVTDDSLGKFKLKSKTKAFCDKEQIKQKKAKAPVDMSETADKLLEEYESYFNENRLQDLISKEGVLDEMKQVGPYLKLLTTDVKEDFLSEHKEEFIGLSDGEKKVIMGSGGRLGSSLVINHIQSK